MTDEPIPSLAAENRPGPPVHGVATHGVNHYTGPEYTSVPKPWLDEQLAEIRRLQNALTQSTTRNCERIMEIERLRARIAELESHAAITFGTLEKPIEDAPTVITHGHAPSAPPHDE
jgi:hypothetical protein